MQKTSECGLEYVKFDVVVRYLNGNAHKQTHRFVIICVEIDVKTVQMRAPLKRAKDKKRREAKTQPESSSTLQQREEEYQED